ncbi:MAG: FAD-dependent oxidoreductase [Clostridia bacterium]
MRNKTHQADLCVVGGGLAGMCAAIAAARLGARVILIHDRPVLGGNASSEIRMWVCGAQGKNLRETGIIEEILLENLYRNPSGNYSIWDSILFEKVRFQENLTLLLNCSCHDASVVKDRIVSVKAWQTTTETFHTVHAEIYCDCSGDGILAPLSGALYRVGRESRKEFNESIQPESPDHRTMGMSCLIQARQTSSQKSFIPPDWAHKYETEEDFPFREHHLGEKSNFWWMELGGDRDSIHDTEDIRDELLKIAFGVWDHIKNHGDHGAADWELEWVGFLPGKRESRRYVGDHVMTQNDVASGGRFEDVVAYGGWPMDDHHPAGFNHKGQPTVYHPAPSPYGIPYRCLYSKNIQNLLCAGRNISVTHAALSSSRVMATCATLGQAAGTAAYLAVKYHLSPRGVYRDKLEELQGILMDNDCHLPGKTRSIGPLSKASRLTANGVDIPVLKNGLDRPSEGAGNGWTGTFGDILEYSLPEKTQLAGMRLVFDSHLARTRLSMPCSYPLDMEPFRLPGSLIREYLVQVRDENGRWADIVSEKENRRRLVFLPVSLRTDGLRFIPLSSWGGPDAHLFSWEVF